ncbi:LacI family transcriptional regulator [Gemmatimonadetes bacterium T265]|nr:LacI family transcriptional regulator [Gemmatimonadetes bacterium T265]
MTATIRDVARMAGVSVATVSRVLTGSAPARDDTRARILEAATALRYTPNSAARSLITRRTGALGVILPDLHGEFFSELLRGADRAAQAEHHHLLVSSSHHDREGIEAALRSMRGRVDALLVMSPELDAESLAANLPAALPVVLLNCDAPASGAGGAEARQVDVLAADNFGGARAMVRHLLALGHTRVAHVAGAARNLDTRERLRGYRAALRESGVARRAAYEAPGDFTEAGGHRAALGLLALAEPPTAICCANDASAIGALSAARELGRRVPEDVAVVGFDDVPMARYVTPPLSTVRVAIDRFGARAVELALGAARRAAAGLPPRAPVRETAPAELVVRTSCGAGSRAPPDAVADTSRASLGTRPHT